jgi:hypothetical protein
MKNSILLALFGIAVISAVPASATTAGFDFSQCGTSSNYFSRSQTEGGSCGADNYSNATSAAFTQTVNGVTVTAAAYATTTDSGAAGTAISDANSNAEIGQYGGYGLGVCSNEESGSPDKNGYNSSSPGGCNSPFHQVNNDGAYEFILFTFSTPVSLNSIIMGNYTNATSNGLDANIDITYWVNPTSLTTIPAGGTTLVCGSGGDAGACPTQTMPGGGIGASDTYTEDTLVGTSVTRLLVGADTSTANTFFKLQALDVTATVTATPEPATFGLIGLSLAGLGLLRRKRKLN